MSNNYCLETLIEKTNWDRYFAEALTGKGQEHANKLWWSLLDRDVNRLIQKLFVGKSSLSILEAGAGAGGTSMELANHLDVNSLCLVDVSPRALSFAQSITPVPLQNKTRYIEADILQLSLNESFDLVWNIGVIEHYPLSTIRNMVEILFAHVRPGGYLVLGIPNRMSLAVIKAALLGSAFGRKYLTFIPGYRNTTEILYANRVLHNLITETTTSPVVTEYAGSMLLVGSPELFIHWADRLFKPNRFSFLTLFIVKKPCNLMKLRKTL